MNKLLPLLLILGCATAPPPPNLTPLKVTLLPQNIDVDTVLPEAKTDKTTPNIKAVRFDPMLFSPPSACMAKDSTGAVVTKPCLSGFLVDEITFAQQNVSDQAKLQQLITTQNSARKYFEVEHKLVREAETAYQTRIMDLEKDLKIAKTPGLWDKIKFETGILAGITLTILTVFAVDRVQKN